MMIQERVVYGRTSQLGKLYIYMQYVANAVTRRPTNVRSCGINDISPLITVYVPHKTLKKHRYPNRTF